MNTSENITEFKIYCADTDLYNVVWHGSYLRYMEGGRVEFLKDFNINIEEVKEKFGIVLPVVNIDIKYKTSAKCGDVVLVKTKIEELKPHYIIFLQEIIDKNNPARIFVTAHVKCTGVTADGKIFKKLAELLRGEI